MTVNWAAIGLFVTLFLAWSGLLIGVIKWLLDRSQRHIDGRFKALEAARENEANEWRRLERQLADLRADLPKEYVRREDWIRFGAVIDAKQDALAARVQTMNEQLQRVLERLQVERGK